MQLRKAVPSDKQNLVQMRLSLQQHVEKSNDEIWKVTELGIRKLEQDVDQMLSDTEGLVLVAEKNGDNIGFAYGSVAKRTDYKPNRVGFINMIFIKEHYRRQGIGKKIVHRLCQYFESNNAEHITLRYAVGNRGAQAFWKRLGFRPIIHTANTKLEQLKEQLQKS